jgi:hypothetical protein
MKKKLLWLERLICEYLGHNRVYIVEPRTRVKGKSKGRVGNAVISFKRKGGKGGSVRVVDGGYYVCARCGKKLTNWERL